MSTVSGISGGSGDNFVNRVAPNIVSDDAAASLAEQSGDVGQAAGRTAPRKTRDSNNKFVATDAKAPKDESTLSGEVVHASPQAEDFFDNSGQTSAYYEAALDSGEIALGTQPYEQDLRRKKITKSSAPFYQFPGAEGPIHSLVQTSEQVSDADCSAALAGLSLSSAKGTPSPAQIEAQKLNANYYQATNIGFSQIIDLGNMGEISPAYKTQNEAGVNNTPTTHTFVLSPANKPEYAGMVTKGGYLANIDLFYEAGNIGQHLLSEQPANTQNWALAA